MGSTIRRQPISNSVPANPTYYYQNIMNFGGINITANPFNADANTASDSLNVYVDEENALTTRPRLSLRMDLKSKLPVEFDEFIGVYSLHNGYLIHGRIAKDYSMYKLTNGTLNRISGTAPSTRCYIFEQENIIYLVSKVGYFEIKNNSISKIQTSGYIPTTVTGKTRIAPGKTLESLNLLSNKFKEEYKWDGTWNPKSLITKYDDVIENQYYTPYRMHYSGSRPQYFCVCRTYGPGYFGPDVRQFLINGYNIDGYYYQSTDLYIANFDKLNFNPNLYFTSVSKPTGVTLPTKYNEICGDISEDGSIMVLCYVGATSHGLYVKRNGVWLDLLNFEHPALSFTDRRRFAVRMSRDGSVIVTWLYGKTLTFVYDGSKYVINREDVWSENKSCCGVDISDDGATAIAYMENTSVSRTGSSWIHILPRDKTSSIKTIDAPHDFFERAAISKKGDVLLAISTGEPGNIIYWYDLSQQNITSREITIPILFSQFMLSDDYSRIYVAGAWGSGWFILQTNELVETSLPIISEHLSDASDLYVENDMFFNFDLNEIRGGSYDFVSGIPNLIVTRTLTESDDGYAEWNTLQTQFLKSDVCTRFANNYWFASNNALFWSDYNNPTYIPLKNHNDIGDSNTEINGLNQISDNVLMAYKTDRLCIITPIIVGDERTYSFTETKNVDGNGVKNTPIVTVLNEYPTFVNYNGIYSLNQLTNVQSSDRIAALLSQAINPKWLSEDKETIDTCKTINRLYWTYYVLNYTKPRIAEYVKPEQISKVYLFDNRSNSWFYWELPISTMDLFVKDNKTVFVDFDGKVYTLETTDIPNKYSPDLLEYYDYGEKLIKWFWKSQILPLKTINYSKKLIDTTFVLTDTDAVDNYGLNYKFTAYRKVAALTTETTISDNLNYVQSTTKRTLIPRFNFIQLEINNIEDDDMFDRNKLRLVGLALKYVLLNQTI